MDLPEFLSLHLGLVALATAPAAHAQVFDASFPSGNVATVTSTGADHYELTLRPDTSSHQRQWFHFSVAQAAGRTLTFDLAPFDISAPWWNGMTPCVTTDPSDPSAWTRVSPADTSYAANRLSFRWTFASDDPVWFAYSFAYPFARADALVQEIAASPYASARSAGSTLQGRTLHLVEITEGSRPNKAGVWIQARQHPAECGSSWTCEALLRWLVGPSDEARALREHAVVRVMPMVNPDGVDAGNYRTNAAGLDLNRQWESANTTQSPEVHAALAELAALDSQFGLALFVDLHTHSSELKSWVFGVDGDPAFDLRERGYAQAIEQEWADFSYALSSFTNGATGVIAKNRIHQLYPDALSYTHEQTYHTLTYGPNAGLPITVERYQRMGEAIGEALVAFEGWSPSWRTYCAPKTNSLGCEPELRLEGTPSFGAAAGFGVVATSVLDPTVGLYFWGLAPESSPLLGGELCVRPPLLRTAPVGSTTGVGCAPGSSGRLEHRWSGADLLSAGLLPGAIVYGQFWSRDAQHPDGTGVSLTGGLWFEVLP